MLRVVYFARVSTEDEKQVNALQVQIEELEEFITSQPDWVLVDKYIEEGISGTYLEKRDEFKRLIEDLSLNKFDIVVAKDETRVGRNAYEAGYFLSPLISNNKKLYYYLDKKFFNPEEELLNMVKYGAAAQFSRDLSKKINGAQKKRMEKGRVITNGRMWGYDQKDAQLFINEKEAEIVRFIFDEYIKGNGFRKIQRKLDEKGITNLNGNSFAISTLKRMIKNEKYKGVLIMGKRHKDFNTKKFSDVPESEWVIHYDKIPAIVSVEIWDRANSILSTKRKESGAEDKRKIVGYFNGTYIYSGKIKCGKCGRPFYHSSYTKQDKVTKMKLWECKGYREYGKNSENGCDNIRIYDNEMDGIVKQVIFEFWQNRDENIQMVIDTLELALSDDKYLENINKLNQEVVKINKKKDKLIELYSDELISKAEFKSRNDEYNSLIEGFQTVIKELEEKNKSTVSKKERLLEVQSFLKTKLDNKDSLTDEIIESFLKEIIVYPDKKIKVVLNGNFEFMVDKVDNEYSLVCPIPSRRGPEIRPR